MFFSFFRQQMTNNQEFYHPRGGGGGKLTFCLYKYLNFFVGCYIITVEFTGMWIRGSQKPLAKRCEKMRICYPHRKGRAGVFFNVFPTFLFCVGVPSVIQQGLGPKSRRDHSLL